MRYTVCMRTLVILLVAGILVALGIFSAQWLGLFAGNPSVQPLPVAQSDVPYRVEVFAEGLEVPWSFVWTSASRMLVSERPGRIRVIENGVLSAQPLHAFSDVSIGGEEGLMSLALHPEYARNAYVYAVYAYEEGSDMYVRVVRFEDKGKSIENLTTILDAIPAAQYHAGSRLGFGPDGMLYITTGDATDRQLAQNRESLAGKILRVEDDGSVPNDNPFPGSAIWSLGHRNPQGLAWHPTSGELYSTEHGPSVFDGPAGGDEVNRIVRGGNYGWPLVSHTQVREGTVAPLQVFTPAEAPGSGTFYAGNVFPQFINNFFFGALRGEGLMRMQFDTENPDRTIGYEKLFSGEYGRIREVAAGPDGFLYFATSNRDSRGELQPGDDKILRLIPQ